MPQSFLTKLARSKHIVKPCELTNTTSILPCPAFYRPFAFKLFEVPINHGKVELTIITGLRNKQQLKITHCHKIKDAHIRTIKQPTCTLNNTIKPQ